MFMYASKKTPLLSIILVLASAFLASISQLIYKIAWNFFNNAKITAFFIYLFAGLFLYAIAFAFFIPALRKGELSTLYPFLATSFLWVSLFSVLFLGEHFNLLKTAGFLSIIIGVIFLGRGSS